MTSKYRVEYALKSHRRDQLIEWIKGLLAVPFVLHSQPVLAFDHESSVIDHSAVIVRARYAQIMADVEALIDDHRAHQIAGAQTVSKLKLLVPSVGSFFTPLLLREAFLYQDEVRRISYRRLVPPSFNDIRLTMNTAQVMTLARAEPVQLVTFDGDVTLYDDGTSLEDDNPVIPRLVRLLKDGKAVGIVTAAGYTEADKYFGRLHGLLRAVRQMVMDSNFQKKPRLVVVGGESSYLFEFDVDEAHLLKQIPRSDWLLPEMKTWEESDMQTLLDVAETALKKSIANLSLGAQIVRKERAVGIIPSSEPGAPKFTREQLEETVLVTQQLVEMSPAGQKIPFCAFNGGNDIFVDIGDKSWGVRACQNYLNGIHASRTLHVGDQFLSAGANDFKARLACTTAWIANPTETVALIDELLIHEASFKAA